MLDVDMQKLVSRSILFARPPQIAHAHCTMLWVTPGSGLDTGHGQKTAISAVSGAAPPPPPPDAHRYNPQHYSARPFIRGNNEAPLAIE